MGSRTGSKAVVRSEAKGHRKRPAEPESSRPVRGALGGVLVEFLFQIAQESLHGGPGPQNEAQEGLAPPRGAQRNAFRGVHG